MIFLLDPFAFHVQKTYVISRKEKRREKKLPNLDRMDKDL